MFIDSHCHIDTIDLQAEHDGNMALLMQEIEQAKVSHLLCVCIDLKNLHNIQDLVKKHPNISYSVGTHPNVILEQEPSDEFLTSIAKDPRCIAIGETGLDYFRNDGDMGWQQERFKQHIRIANQQKMPLIIHTRQAADDTVKILKEQAAEQAIMHCFAEDWQIAEQCLELGYYISLSGIVSFKNAIQVHEVAKKIPLERLLIETDSPYLAPMPYRGKQNRPSWVAHVCQAVADLRGMSVEEVAKITTENFLRLFPSVTL